MASSFRFFGYRKSVDTVTRDGLNSAYADLAETERMIGVMEQRKRTLFQQGVEAKKRNNTLAFNKVMANMGMVNAKIRTLQGRTLAMQKQIDSLDQTKDRLNNVKMAKTIVGVNKRVVSEFGGMDAMSHLSQELETTSLEMEEGVGSMADDLFSGEEMLEEMESGEMSSKEASAIWDQYTKEFGEETGAGVDELELRLMLMGSPTQVSSSSTPGVSNSTSV